MYSASGEFVKFFKHGKMALTNELLKSLEAKWEDFGSFAHDLIADNNVPFDNHEV